MGDVAAQITAPITEQVITLLNQALASEWLAYIQYDLGAAVAVGPMRPDIQKELAQHAEEEKGHADQLVERIIQLGGVPVMSPEEFIKQSPTPFRPPTDPVVTVLLQENIAGEQDAIRFYNTILAVVDGKDRVTYDMIVDILADEDTHETELQMLQDDLTVLFDAVKEQG